MAFVKRRKGERQGGGRRAFPESEVYGGGHGSLKSLLYSIFPSAFHPKSALAQRKEHRVSRKHQRLQPSALSAYCQLWEADGPKPKVTLLLCFLRSISYPSSKQYQHNLGTQTSLQLAASLLPWLHWAGPGCQIRHLGKSILFWGC